MLPAAQLPEQFHELLEPLRIQLSKKIAVPAKSRPHNKTVRDREVIRHILHCHAGSDYDRHTRSLFYSPKLDQVRRLSRARASHDDTVNEKKFRLFHFIGDVEISGERVRTVFLLQIGENFDVFASEFLSFAQELAGAPFDDAGPPDMGEDVAFDTEEIEVGGMRDFKPPIR